MLVGLRNPAQMGPSVRNAAAVACPMPCTMPSTDGCGEQLFSKVMEAGTQNMRPVLCTNSKTRMQAQVIADVPAMMTRKGEMA